MLEETRIHFYFAREIRESPVIFNTDECIADVESESSQSQDTESAFSIKNENASDFNQIDDDSQEGPKPLNFQTKTVKGETFILFLSFLSSLSQHIQLKNITLKEKCDRPDCPKVFQEFHIFHGCGHSFHTSCLNSGKMVCLICSKELANSMKVLSEKACDGLHHHEDDDDSIVANEIDANCGDDEDEESGVEELEKQEPRISCTLLQLKQQIFSWSLIPGQK
eukprot:gene9812-18382_t